MAGPGHLREPYDPPAVRYFTPEGSRLPRGWRVKVLERMEELKGYLASSAAVDFADYRFRCGQLSGLSEAITIVGQLEKDEGN